MRLLIRLAGGTGAPVDLRVDATDATTVGELADHLADRFPELLDRDGHPGSDDAPALTIVVAASPAPEVLDRGERLCDAGPRSGSTIGLARWASSGADARPVAPVELVAPGAAPQVLRYGTTVVDGSVFEVDEHVMLRSTAGVTPSINGERVLGGGRVQHGDLVWTGRRTVEVRLTAALRPPPPRGTHEPLRRTSEHRVDVAPVTVELPTPPGATRLPGFPALSATVPLLMGVALWILTRSAASAAFVLFSFVFVVASGIESRRESRADRRFREEEYRQDLADSLDALEGCRTGERERALRRSPHVEQVARIVATRDARVWERSGSAADGCLVARLGTAMLAGGDRVVPATTGRRDLLAEARAEVARLASTRRPVVVDLDETNGVAVVGIGETATAVARSITAQLVGLVGPDELAVRVLASPERRPRWAWCDWLPHSHTAAAAPRTLLVVDGADDDEIGRAATSLSGPVRVVWVSASDAGLPRGVRAVLTVAEAASALALLDEHGAVTTTVDDVDVEDLTQDQALALARSLCPLTPVPALDLTGDAADRPSASLPSSVSLRELTDGRGDPADPGETVRRWQASARAATLTAPIGVTGSGPLNVDLREDGPHALVAGTTGAGKSELLRTLVASLAVHHAPDRLTFLLVDYKGGAAFRSLTDLPHTVGLITDLDEALAVRALRSLRAEVRRREEVLADRGAIDLRELDECGAPDRPPALAVVVDEFATLTRELPAFVDGLVDIAQRGRSLGIHMVLATQRPAGVVTDAIRANTTLRIALRVADEDDSRDVVDTPLAAHLTREAPGRAVVRTGPDRSALAQIAWSGGSSAGVPRIDVGPLAGPAAAAVEHHGPTELEAVVRAVSGAATRMGIAPPRRPWAPPLGDVVTLAEVGAAGRGSVALGWVDRPDAQRRDPLLLDLERDGGVLVLGAGGSGRSTALCTVAAALAAGATAAGGPDGAVQVHAIDAGRGLGPLDGSVDVVRADDAERVLRLLRATERDVAARLGGAPAVPRRILLLDGFAAFEEVHERVNRGEALDLIGRIARDGRAVGVHLAVSAQRRAEVPPSLGAALGFRLQLRCTSEDDAVMAGLPASAADPRTPPGRGHVGADLVQVAAPGDAVRLPSTRRDEVPVLPRRVALAQIPYPGAAATGGPWRIAVGLDADRLDAAMLDLEHHHAVVAGPPRSGVSTALATVATGAQASFLVCARAGDGPAAGDWARVAPWSTGADGIEGLFAAAARTAAAGRRTLLAVDDLPDLLERPGGHDLERLLGAVLDQDPATPLRLVVGGEVGALARCYSDVLTRLRSGRTGLLLQPDPDLHPALLHASLPRRDELPACAGRGWLLGPGGAVALQVAVR